MSDSTPNDLPPEPTTPVPPFEPVTAPGDSSEPARVAPIFSLITNRKLLVGRTIDDVVKVAVANGVNHVQLRELDLSARDLLTLAEWMKQVIGGHAVLVIHDRVDVAMACEADGVHLSPSGLSTRVARKLVGPHCLIGRSVESINDAVRAAREGADYVQMGPVFETDAPKTRILGVSSLEIAVREVGVPILAAGGIHRHNVAQVIKAGVAGVAVQSSVMKAADAGAAAHELHDAIEWAWDARYQ